eukprot:751654-Hanusia_phi.AAC.3
MQARHRSLLARGGPCEEDGKEGWVDVMDQEVDEGAGSFTGLACMFFADEEKLDIGAIKLIDLRTEQEEVKNSLSSAPPPPP